MTPQELDKLALSTDVWFMPFYELQEIVSLYEFTLVQVNEYWELRNAWGELMLRGNLRAVSGYFHGFVRGQRGYLSVINRAQ